MIEYSQTTILVEGTTDTMGSQAYNQNLSERRAKNVKHMLIARGVQPHRITILGYGN